MTSSEKLRFLLIRQCVYFGGTIGMLALTLMRSQMALILALLLFIALVRFVMPRWEKKLRESECRLTPQQNIFFGVGMNLLSRSSLVLCFFGRFATSVPQPGAYRAWVSLFC